MSVNTVSQLQYSTFGQNY